MDSSMAHCGPACGGAGAVVEVNMNQQEVWNFNLEQELLKDLRELYGVAYKSLAEIEPDDVRCYLLELYAMCINRELGEWDDENKFMPRTKWGKIE